LRTGLLSAGSRIRPGDLGPNPNPSLGILQNRTLDPHFRREYNLQHSAGIQQQITRGVTLNFNWNRRADYQQVLTLNDVPPSAWNPSKSPTPWMAHR
jgi:hypothetical protein